MINAKGETIYTNAEIGYELGLSPATINACAKRLYGNRIAYWTLTEAEMIVKYIKSISVEQEAIRIKALHDMIEREMGGKRFDDTDTRKRIDNDIYLKEKV